MKWEVWNQLSKEQKEEYNYRFKVVDITSLNLLPMCYIWVFGQLLTLLILLTALSIDNQRLIDATTILIHKETTILSVFVAVALFAYFAYCGYCLYISGKKEEWIRANIK